MSTSQPNTMSAVATPTKARFLTARIYLAKDGQYLLHILPDGSILRRHVNYYRRILARAHWLERVVTSPFARLAGVILSGVIRILLVVWLALHPVTNRQEGDGIHR